MNEIIVICGENLIRAQEILRELTQDESVAKAIPVYTTNEKCGYGYVNVSSNEFFDMVEEGKFFDYQERDGAYYGTLHLRSNVTDEKTLFILSDVNVALEIKRYNKKVVTIYVLSKEKEQTFKHPEVVGKDEYVAAKQLDFLVIDSDLDDTVKKIQNIINFMKENMMRLKY